MEKMTYQEARELFWIKTLIWFVPAIIVSVAALYLYSGEMLDPTARLRIAVGVGIVNVLIGLFCAFLSLQFPWMSAGRWFAFLLTGPICTGMASGTTFVLGGLALAVIARDPINIPTRDLMDLFYKVLIYAIGASGLWGLMIGVWFSLRRDKYFVEIV